MMSHGSKVFRGDVMSHRGEGARSEGKGMDEMRLRT